MPYVIKLVSENCYIIPDGDGWLTTTDSQQEAIEIGLFDDFEAGDETAQSFIASRKLTASLKWIASNSLYPGIIL